MGLDSLRKLAIGLEPSMSDLRMVAYDAKQDSRIREAADMARKHMHEFWILVAELNPKRSD
jgi:hypothetical protein